MRRRGGVIVVVHRNVQDEEYYANLYPAIKREEDNLVVALGGKKHANIRVTQVSFFRDYQTDKKFSSPKQESASAIALGRVLSSPGQLKKSSFKLMGTCVLIHLRAPAKGPARSRGLKSQAIKKDYVVEALVHIPVTGALSSENESALETHLDRLLPAADGMTSYIHVQQDAEAIVAGEPVEINASYYSQQNGITSVCAHCCLRAALWYIDQKKRSGYAVSSETLNKLAETALRDTNGGAFDPRNGLSPGQMEYICRRLGADLLTVDFMDYPQPPYACSPYELAYSLVESGFPTMMLFLTGERKNGRHIGHVVPVVGHTWSADEWLPVAVRHYERLPHTGLVTAPKKKLHLSSVEWAPHLVVHDDLLGPYFSLGPNVLLQHVDPRLPDLGRITNVIAVVPKGSGLNRSPVLAQHVARKLFYDCWGVLKDEVTEPWRKRLICRWGETQEQMANQLVLRTQACKWTDYLNHLTNARDHFDHIVDLDDWYKQEVYRITKKRAGPSEWVWLVEITLPELLTGNLSKLGEIILPLDYADPDNLTRINKNKRYNPVICRFINRLLLFPSRTGYFFDIAEGIQTHMPLFTRGLDNSGAR